MSALCIAGTAFAGNATWLAAPPTSDFNSVANWTAGGPPSGASETATFDVSATTAIALTFNRTLSGIDFTAAASAYTFTGSGNFGLTFNGTGISNASAVAQTFDFVAGTGVFITSPESSTLTFNNSATAGNAILSSTGGAGLNTSGVGGDAFITFNNSSSAGTATIANTGGTGTSSGVGGRATLSFTGTATAGNATITNNGGTQIGATGGTATINFSADSTAGNATITNGPLLNADATASIAFSGNATAGSATITNGGSAVTFLNGSATSFSGSSTAGTANFINSGGLAADAVGGLTNFSGTSTAANGTFVARGGAVVQANGGSVTFNSTATAANATFTIEGGGVSGAFGGTLVFFGNSTAGNSTTTIAAPSVVGGAPGTVRFTTNATAGASTLTANAGSIDFQGASTGGTASISLAGASSSLQFNGRSVPAVTIGSLAGVGSVALGTTTLTVGANNASTAFSGVISGLGGLIKTGTGTLTLGQINTYTGTTTVNAGSLTLANDGVTTFGRLGTGTVTINGAASGGDPAGTLRFGGISSAATSIVTVNGGTGGGAGGILQFANDSTGALAVTVQGNATLDISAHNTGVSIGSLAGSGNVLLGSKTLTVGSNNGSTTFSGAIQNSGRFAKIGTGTLTLTGANTYTGRTTIKAGTLAVAGGSITAPAENIIVGETSGDSATLQASAGASLSGTQLYVGFNAGSQGSATLTGVGSQWNLASILVVGANGTGALDVADGATLTSTFSSHIGSSAGSSGTVTVSGAGSSWTNNGVLTVGTGGTGTLTIQDGGTVTLTAPLELAAVAGSSGTLNLGTGAAAGTLAVSAVNGGSGTAIVNINHNAAATFASNFTGSLGLNQNGGSTTLTGASTYTGGTTIAGGTLQIGAGGTAGSVTGNVLDNAALAFNRSDAVTYAGNISGTGTVTKLGANTLTLTGANTHAGATTITAGTLQVGAGGSAGSTTSDIVNNAALSFDRSDALTYGGSISGTGTLTKLGGGTLTLTGANVHTGGTTVTAGTLQVGAGGSTGAIAGNIVNNAALAFDRTDAVTFAGDIGGTGTLTKLAANTLTLSGTNVYTGNTDVTAGTLRVTGSLGASAVTVASGATLGGTGTLGGTVTIQSGGHLAPGASPGTITVGSLSLVAGSILDYELATPGVVGGGVNDLIAVTGNLTLDGTLNVTDAGGFGAGVYRLFNYGGTLTDNGLILGTAPSGLLYGVQTTVANQVNLLVDPGQLQFWDGSNTTANGVIDGGSAIWNGVATNWTDASGSISNVWLGRTAIFGGTAGVVSLGAPTAFEGLQFTTTGYVIDGTGANSLSPTGAASIRTDPGVAATLAAALSGTGSVTKTGTGTLTLTGANTHTGGTIISEGVLEIGAGGTTGSLAGGITNNASLRFNRSNADTFSGVISGTGAIVKTGAGTLILSGDHSYTGGTTISSGTLQIGGGGTTGSIVGNVVNNGTLAFDRSDAAAFANDVSGTGTFTKLGAGSLTLTGTNSHAGGTTVAAGTLQIGAGGTLGSIAGNIANEGVLVFNRSDAVTFADVVSGGGSLTQAGAGTLTLSGANTYSGGTTISAGTLQIGAGTTIGSIVGNVINNAALAFDRSDAVTFAGSISGSGTLTQLGTGALTLTGVHTYTGATAVAAGQLVVNGTLAGSTTVASGASLGGTGTIAGTVTLQDGASLAPGTSPGTLTVGALSLSSGSMLNFELGTPDVVGGATNDLIAVTGDLTLDGTLNITAGAGYGVGVYRLINYGGVLTDNGLTLGTQPGSYLYGVQVNLANQINLLVDPISLQFWDGSNSVANNVVDGGTAAWDGPTTNWANAAGTSNAKWGGHTAIFSGTAGVVTIAAPSAFEGMQFTTTGYTIRATSGNSLTPTGTATMRTDAGVTATISAELSGEGGIVKEGTGTLILDGNNTYTAGTTIAAGTLQVGAGGTSGALAGSVANNAALVFNRSDASTFAGTLSGTGSLTKRGGGTLTLTGAASHAGGTTIDAGTLQIGNSSTGGSLAGDVVNNAAIAFARSDTLTFAGAISGTGTLSKVGAGRLILTGTNTYAGGTTVTAGTLQLGAGGTTGSITGSVANSGTLAFNRSDAVTYSGVVSGTGALVQLGSGTLTLTNANTYTGGTTISAGTVQLGAGGTSGSVSGNVLNHGVLLFNRSDAVTFAGGISGSGALTKLNSNTLTLSGVNSFTGRTRVEAGRLTLNTGSSVASVDVAAGATLNGTGSVRGDLVNAGVVVPGNPTGTLSVTGNFLQGSGGKLQIEITSLAAFGHLAVGGSVSLDGTLEVVAPSSLPVSLGQRYEVISAANVTGRFANVVSPFTSLPLAVGFETLYEPRSVALAFVQRPYAPFAYTPNQFATGAGLDAAVNAGQASGIQTAFNTYLAVEPFRAGFNQLSPQRYERWFNSAVFSTGALVRTVEDRGGESSATVPRRAAWAEVIHRDADFSGDADLAAADLKTEGIIAGVEQTGATGMAFGGLLAYEQSTLDLDANGSRTRIKSFQPALYARYSREGWRTEAVAGYAAHDYESRRVVAIPNYVQAAQGETKGSHRFASVRTSYRLPLHPLTVTPFAGLQYLDWDADGFTESAAGDASLRIWAQRGDSLASRLGLRLALPFHAGAVLITPHLEATARHEFHQGRRNLTAQLAGTSFTVRSQSPSTDGWVASFGFDAAVREDLSLYARITREGDGAVESSTDLRAGASYQF